MLTTIRKILLQHAEYNEAGNERYQYSYYKIEESLRVYLVVQFLFPLLSIQVS